MQVYCIGKRIILIKMKLLKNTIVLFICSIFFLCYFPILIVGVLIDIITGAKLLKTKIGYYLTIVPEYISEKWMKLK